MRSAGEKIGEGASWAGRRIGDGASWAGKKVGEGYNWAKSKVTGKGAEAGAGHSLRTIDDVYANPQLLRGKTPEDAEKILGGTPGWRVENLGRGSHKGQGWVLRKYNEGVIRQVHTFDGTPGMAIMSRARTGE